MDVLLHLLAVLARNRLLLLPAFLLLAFCGWGPSPWRRWMWRLAMVACGLGIFFGAPVLSDWLLYRVGQTATAQVTGTYATWTEINDHDVVGYNVLIRVAPDKLVESRFEDDEVNVFPPADFDYPQPNETFDVRYVPGFPRDFIILTDDDSPWARRQRCNDVSLRLTAAQQRYDFAHGAIPYRQPYVAAIDAYLQQGCAGGAEGTASFLNDRARAEAGQVDPAE